MNGLPPGVTLCEKNVESLDGINNPDGVSIIGAVSSNTKCGLIPTASATAQRNIITIRRKSNYSYVYLFKFLKY